MFQLLWNARDSIVLESWPSDRSISLLIPSQPHFFLSTRLGWLPQRHDTLFSRRHRTTLHEAPEIRNQSDLRSFNSTSILPSSFRFVLVAVLVLKDVDPAYHFDVGAGQSVRGHRCACHHQCRRSWRNGFAGKESVGTDCSHSTLIIIRTLPLGRRSTKRTRSPREILCLAPVWMSESADSTQLLARTR